MKKIYNRNEKNKRNTRWKYTEIEELCCFTSNSNNNITTIEYSRHKPTYKSIYEYTLKKTLNGNPNDSIAITNVV